MKTVRMLTWLQFLNLQLQKRKYKILLSLNVMGLAIKQTFSELNNCEFRIYYTQAYFSGDYIVKEIPS